MPELKLFEEADRQLTICNACRYCEGLCPVFRAIETHRSFAGSEILHLANLCHDCRVCYYACMFTPPHEFALNIPQILSQARLESYKRWSWPGILAGGFEEPRITSWLALFSGLLVIVVGCVAIGLKRLFVAHTGLGAFYEVVPYSAVVIPAILLTVYGAAVWIYGMNRSWQESATSSGAVSGKAFLKALAAAVSLRHLTGGGPGCAYPTERPSAVRRIYHSFVFWGFLLDFISTSVAFVYQDVFRRSPPYSYDSAPVLFGFTGGILLILGTSGLIYFKRSSDYDPALKRAYGMDYLFLVVLSLTAVTGMLTLIFRTTREMPPLFVVHLAAVAALFITAPYSKLVHAMYRTLALVRYYAGQAS